MKITVVINFQCTLSLNGGRLSFYKVLQEGQEIKSTFSTAQSDEIVPQIMLLILMCDL